MCRISQDVSEKVDKLHNYVNKMQCKAVYSKNSQ